MIRIRHVLSVDGRVDGAGEDAVDVDVIRVVFGGKTFGECDHCTFSDAVGRHVAFASKGGAC